MPLRERGTRPPHGPASRRRRWLTHRRVAALIATVVLLLGIATAWWYVSHTYPERKARQILADMRKMHSPLFSDDDEPGVVDRFLEWVDKLFPDPPPERPAGGTGGGGTGLFIDDGPDVPDVWFPEIQELVDLGPRAVPVLIEALDDDADQVRLVATVALGRIGDRRAFDKLLANLPDPGDEEPGPIISALGGLRDPRAVPALTRFLATEHDGEAVSALLEIDPDGVAVVIAAARDATCPGRMTAIRALQRVRGERGVDALAELLQDNDAAVRRAAATALFKIGRSAVEAISGMATDKSSPFRQEAIRALGDIATPQAASALMQLLCTEEDLPLCGQAVDALERCGQPVVRLSEVLHDGTVPARLAALDALRSWEGKAVAPALIAVLLNTESLLRQRAAEALGDLGDARAVEPLVNAMADSDVDVVSASGMALAKIGGPSVGPLLDILSTGKAPARIWAAMALGEMGDRRAMGPLIDTLKDRDTSVRRAAAKALGGLPDPRSTQALLAAMKDEDPGVRGDAIGALSAIGGDVPTGAILSALSDPTAYVRHTAVKVVRSRNLREALPRLIAMLADPTEEGHVLLIVIHAVEDMPDARAIGPLEIIAREGSTMVRRDAARALMVVRQRQASTQPSTPDGGDDVNTP
jgi:HEAT repeat protein